jgi:hypothetical protein
VPKEKAQLCLPQVTYLGVLLKGQTHSLYCEQIDPILHFPLPWTIKQISTFLGVTGFCRIWIPKYAALARPPYQLLKHAQRGSQFLLKWDPEITNAFQVLKLSLQTVLALNFLTREHFQLCVYEKGGTALGVLTQL